MRGRDGQIGIMTSSASSLQGAACRLTHRVPLMPRIPAGFVMATHAEVMMTSEGLRLIEPGALTPGSSAMISGLLDAGILGEIEAMAP